MFIHQFWQMVNRRKKQNSSESFNYLYDIRPELAEEIRGTNSDPFYASQGDAQWNRFVQFLKKRL